MLNVTSWADLHPSTIRTLLRKDEDEGSPRRMVTTMVTLADHDNEKREICKGKFCTL